jgi:small-conductance mechanosensitive channel
MWVFDTSLSLGLITIFFVSLHAKLHFRTKILTTACAIILLYRIVSYITIYLYGDTSWWAGVYSDNLNHYELGFVLLFICFLFRNYFNKHLLATLLGIASGLIIDETSDLLKLIPFIHLPYHFRDSLGDLVIIVISYLIFAILFLKMKTPWTQFKK